MLYKTEQLLPLGGASLPVFPLVHAELSSWVGILWLVQFVGGKLGTFPIYHQLSCYMYDVCMYTCVGVYVCVFVRV